MRLGEMSSVYGFFGIAWLVAGLGLCIYYAHSTKEISKLEYLAYDFMSSANR